MSNRWRISIMLASLISLVFAVPALAGGWAVITLDELPSSVVAGEPVTIGFTVLQHGRTPMTGLTPTITANLYKEQEFVVEAEPQGKPGHYSATVTFPKEGKWRWSIQAFTMDQRMPMLTVAAPTVTAAEAPDLKAEPVPSLAIPMVLTGMAVMALGLAAAIFGLRRRSRPIMAFTVLCFLAGIVLLLAGADRTSAVEAQSKSDVEVLKSAEDVSLSQVELGRDLFIAKGCITCHYNSRAGSPSDYWTIELGAPDLSRYSSDPTILFIRLKDPRQPGPIPKYQTWI